MARFVGEHPTSAMVAEIIRQYPTKRVNLLDVKRAGLLVGLQLNGWQMTLKELQVNRQPFIAAMKDHFVFVDYVGDKWVRLFEGENPSLVRLEQFSTNYEGSVLLPSNISTAPMIEINQPVQDVGIVPLNTPGIRVKFQVRNTGEIPIHIQSVTTTCTCTETLPFPSILSPHEVVPLEVSVSVPNTGELGGVVMIRSDAAHPIEWANVVGMMENSILFDPPRIYIDKAMPNAEVHRTIQIIDKDHKFVRPLKVETSSANVVAENIVAEETGFKILLKIKPQVLGAIDEAIFIRNARGDGKDVKIPIAGTVSGPFSAKPGMVFFGAVARDEGATREMRLTHDDAQPFEITKIDCPTGVTAEFAPLAQNKTQWLVTIRVAPAARPATIQGDLVVQIAGNVTALTVPLFAVVQ